MALQIVQKDWSDIMLYVRDKLRDQLNKDKMLSEQLLLGTLAVCTLDRYLEDTQQKKERKKTVQTDGMFKAIWNEYPSSASFQYRGMKFTSSRVLRANYQVCEMLYQKAVADKSVTGEQILAAIKKQVQMVKEESYESGQNRMQYMSSLEVYLRQSRYEAFLYMENDNIEEEFGSNCA